MISTTVPADGANESTCGGVLWITNPIVIMKTSTEDASAPVEAEKKISSTTRKICPPRPQICLPKPREKTPKPPA
eukprot:jgi/Pico_ML_1/53722/g4222.t1